LQPRICGASVIRQTISRDPAQAPFRKQPRLKQPRFNQPHLKRPSVKQSRLRQPRLKHPALSEAVSESEHEPDHGSGQQQPTNGRPYAIIIGVLFVRIMNLFVTNLHLGFILSYTGLNRRDAPNSAANTDAGQLRYCGSQSAICGKNITRSMPMIWSAMNGKTATKISCNVTSLGATDFNQKHAGPNGGDRK